MTPLTVKDLLGPYAAEPWSPAELASGGRTVQAWNELAGAAEADGVVLLINPATGCHIGGSGNGGARPKGSKVGAPGSMHQLLLALDWFDPQRALMRWILSYGLERATALGMYFEHPQWTRSWGHGQVVAPGEGLTRWNIFFIPYRDMLLNPPTCAALEEQAFAAVPAFPFKAAA
jgi:hypothetical protein